MQAAGAVPSVPRVPSSKPAKTASPEELELPPRSLDRLRTSLKFSLWTWALYWPGGGLLLLYGGLDPISLAVTLLALAAFLAMLASGALDASSSRTMKEFLLERPLYLVAGLVVLVVLAAVVPSVEGFALLLFAAAWFGGLALAARRLVEHVRGQGLGIWRSRADQLLVVFALAGFFSLLVFLDALLPILADGATLGSPAGLVAVSTWVGLLYPALVLVASRPFREPLRRPRVQVSVALDAKPAARRRKAPAPQPFRAS